MILPAMMKFSLGKIVITTGVLESIAADEICHALDHHVTGDWRNLDAQDRQANELAVHLGSRVVSVFHAANDIQFLVVTEAGHALTTVALPDEN